MIQLIFGIIVMSIIAGFIYMSFYAKRLTEMKDDRAIEKIISNKNIAKSGLVQFYIYPMVIFILFGLIYLFF